MPGDNGTVNKMMAVRCPACDERVEGSSSEDLSRSITSHFADVHNMDIDVEMNVSDEGCGCDTGSRSGETSMFECPVCREKVRGSNEEEMSESFREHLATTIRTNPSSPSSWRR